MVEGTVNIKMIKRQTHGRVGLGLLRKRVNTSGCRCTFSPSPHASSAAHGCA